jgi:hypothetical protein
MIYNIVNGFIFEGFKYFHPGFMQIQIEVVDLDNSSAIN